MNSDFTVNQRFVEAMDYIIESELAYNQADFAKKLKVSRSLISDIKSFNKVATERYVRKLCEIYPIISEKWILTGKGVMVPPLESSAPNLTSNINGNSNTSVAGNGNQITTANLTEMIELQKGYQEMLKTSQEQITKLIELINEKLK